MHLGKKNTVVTGRYYYPDQEKMQTEDVSDDANESVEAAGEDVVRNRPVLIRSKMICSRQNV